MLALVASGIVILMITIAGTPLSNRGPTVLQLVGLSLTPVCSFLAASYSRQRILFLIFGMAVGFFFALSMSPPRRPIWTTKTDDIFDALMMSLWPLMLGLLCRAAVTIRKFWDKSPAIDHPICAECGYNLTGNVSGICPECGSSITIEGEKGKEAE
ncbi:MAG TPA: hypothetical protein VNT79_03325 [Phycisphaerae bacterium]|nr:hypothetical protein [Phycisphaerae bacterium]